MYLIKNKIIVEIKNFIIIYIIIHNIIFKRFRLVLNLPRNCSYRLWYGGLPFYKLITANNNNILYMQFFWGEINSTYHIILLLKNELLVAI